MSSKSSFKPHKPKPRPLEDIGKDYAEVRSKLGDAQYQEYIWKTEAARLCRVLRELSTEATERQKLDAQDKSKDTEVKLTPVETKEEEQA